MERPMTPEQTHAAWQNGEPIEPVQLARALRDVLEDHRRWKCVQANPFAAADALVKHADANDRIGWAQACNEAMDAERNRWGRP
jgi:hypothetical protein